MAPHEDIRELLAEVSGHLQALAASRLSDEATALDVAQQVLLRALLNVDRLRRLPDQDVRRHYLATMLRNKIAEVMGRERRHRELLPRAAQRSGPSDLTSLETWGQAIWDCVRMLPDRDRGLIDKALVEGHCELGLGRELHPNAPPSTQFRKGHSCLEDLLLQLRILVYRSSVFLDAFRELYDGRDPYWTLFRPGSDLNEINTFLCALQVEEAACLEETLVLGSVSSTIIPESVQEARADRILDSATPQTDRRVLKRLLREVLSILGERRERFRDRVRRVAVTHIACKETIESMVRGGWCPAEHALHRFEEAAFLTAEEGRASVEEAIRLLTDCSHFRMGLTDREEGGPLFSGWKVVGGRSVFLKTWRGQRGQQDQVDVVIRDKRIANDFGNSFRRRYRALPPESRDRTQVIRWLERQLARA